jgi:uncharacterized LabA/DUF88 family protein
MLFADGENLLLRYEAMLKKGATPRPQTTHFPGEFVWSAFITKMPHHLQLQFTRVAYYTTHVGSEQTLQQLRTKLKKVEWNTQTNPLFGGHLLPRVFKKPAQSQKTASVDINITIDVLRHCYHKDVEAVYILTGDGDYIPLVEEAMRTGTRLFVGAFSEGLNQTLRVIADEFFNLDDMFFGNITAL